MTAVIAMIGAGNMGQCLLGGLIKNHYPPDKLWLTSKTGSNLQALQKKYGVNTTTDNALAVSSADILILAVKPVIIPEILIDLKKTIQDKKPLLISLAAGICIESIEHVFDCPLSVVRCMPNIPSVLGVGASALYANAHTSTQEREEVESIFRSVGVTLWLEKETLMNPVTALSGCGPAYFFYLIDILQKAGEALGLTREAARLLTLQTAYGACRMALVSDKEASQLVKEVASPGGSTLEALRVLDEHQLQTIFCAALKAATEKAKSREEELKHAMEKNA